MTRERYETSYSSDGGFGLLMKSLNLDSTQFGDIDTNWDQHDLPRLQSIKQDIETQLDTLFDVLRVLLRADMETLLVTGDGFPRSDIDVVGIRLVRVRIIRLRNDHRQVLHHLERRMVEYFLRAREATTLGDSGMDVDTDIGNDDNDAIIVEERIYNIPFANVLEVAENGPAHIAGLQEGDMLVLFDDIHAGNFRNLQELSVRVQRLLDQTVPVQVIGADASRRTLTLRPHVNWGGRGALGCRIVPI